MNTENMSAEQRANAIDRIRKMLRLAGDAGATEGERDNAMRMAYNTMKKLNLDMATLEAERPESKERPDEPRKEETAAFVGWPHARNICASIADLFFCNYLYSGKGSTHTRHHFVGRLSNATTAAIVAEFVVKSVQAEAWAHAKRNFGGSAMAREFCWGAARHIRKRVDEMKAEATKSTTVAPEVDRKNALVLASFYDSEKKSNQLFIASQYGKLGRGHGGKSFGLSSSYAAGHAYGGKVSLDVQVGHSPKGRIK